jgi:GNAT superfamily N-acetyltransferase
MMSLLYLSKQLFHQLLNSFKIFKEKGFRAGLNGLRSTVGRIFYQRAGYEILLNTCSEPPIKPTPRPDVTIRQIVSPEEIANLSRIAVPVDINRFHQLFAGGSIGLIAFQNNEAVGYCWASPQVDTKANRVQAALLNFRSGDVYAHDLFISPTQQGNGLGRALVFEQICYLREYGYKRIFSAVDKGSLPSLKIHKKVGYQYIGELWHTRILLWNRFFYDKHTRRLLCVK